MKTTIAIALALTAAAIVVAAYILNSPQNMEPWIR